MASDPPLWLLDVDGVVNAVSLRPDPDVWDDWKQGFATADDVVWPIHFSPSAIRQIRALLDDGLAEARWLTTWGDAANASLSRLLGLPGLPVEGLAERGEAAWPPAAGGWHGALFHAGSDEWWKFPVVRDVVDREGSGRPLIWTDDDLAVEPEAVRWIRAHVDDALLIAPDPATGLTADDLAAIREFCLAGR